VLPVSDAIGCRGSTASGGMGRRVPGGQRPAPAPRRHALASRGRLALVPSRGDVRRVAAFAAPCVLQFHRSRTSPAWAARTPAGGFRSPNVSRRSRVRSRTGRSRVANGADAAWHHCGRPSAALSQRTSGRSPANSFARMAGSLGSVTVASVISRPVTNDW